MFSRKKKIESDRDAFYHRRNSPKRYRVHLLLLIDGRVVKQSLSLLKGKKRRISALRMIPTT